ncbi:MAG: hypothetical protein US50_C0001G0027 [Candidatus Nomurabacteria bacterium GW2011_GWB1_37_5]|uniref:Uncharacterized protein n=1 Tax=Candidatus Nomurabacteria bacterium GW2011_GWB1_37_5 TaxID=1618742 RepID=A0A0G0HBT7_9BACT|nr:MAG: hypothetical protein US50_C0001G0027 [Candidatus Nomurabacteria bacterium GW2011_GWB1_37_5]
MKTTLLSKLAILFSIAFLFSLMSCDRETVSEQTKTEVENWQSFYLEVFNLTTNFQLKLNSEDTTFSQMIIVPKGLTLNQIASVFTKHLKPAARLSLRS